MPQPSSNWLTRIFVALVALAIVLGIALQSTSERRALRAIPDAQRAELLSHAITELRDLCGPAASGAVKDHCREVASFASRFDACRGECEQLVHRELAPSPTR